MEYKVKKVLTIGSVSDLTGLTGRQIRYYEERKLIEPARTAGGTRKYSFLDVERLVDISRSLAEGDSTFQIKERNRRSRSGTNKMIEGQLNSFFRKF